MKGHVELTNQRINKLTGNGVTRYGVVGYEVWGMGSKDNGERIMKGHVELTNQRINW